MDIICRKKCHKKCFKLPHALLKNYSNSKIGDNKKDGNILFMEHFLVILYQIYSNEGFSSKMATPQGIPVLKLKIQTKILKNEAVPRGPVLWPRFNFLSTLQTQTRMYWLLYGEISDLQI